MEDIGAWTWDPAPRPPPRPPPQRISLPRVERSARRQARAARRAGAAPARAPRAAPRVRRPQPEPAPAGLADRDRRRAGLQRGDDHRDHRRGRGHHPHLLQVLRHGRGLLPRRLRRGGGDARGAAGGGLGGGPGWPARVRRRSPRRSSSLPPRPSSPASSSPSPSSPGRRSRAATRRRSRGRRRSSREGRELSTEAAAFPATTERGLIGSIASQVGRKASAGEAAELPALLDLVQFALTPYLGGAEARRIALAKG